MLFTVFTPTYNRAHTLHRVFDSLKVQTCKDFEWLIVDDGSKDGTADFVRQCQLEADFPIRYVYKENGGKHTAMIVAVREARGELFCTFDSDDACIPEAFEQYREVWESIPASERAGFAGVTCLCMDVNGNVVGDKYPSDVLDSTALEVHYRYGVSGEKWAFQRTDILRNFPFPQPSKRVSHVPEGIVWARIGRHYKTRFVNRTLRVYYQDAPTQSLSRTAIISPAAGRAGFVEHQEALSQNMDWFWTAPIMFARSATHYTRFALHSGMRPSEFLFSLSGAGLLLAWLFAIPGALVYVRDRGIARRHRNGEAAAAVPAVQGTDQK